MKMNFLFLKTLVYASSFLPNLKEVKNKNLCFFPFLSQVAKKLNRQNPKMDKSWTNIPKTVIQKLLTSEKASPHIIIILDFVPLLSMSEMGYDEDLIKLGD